MWESRVDDEPDHRSIIQGSIDTTGADLSSSMLPSFDTRLERKIRKHTHQRCWADPSEDSMSQPPLFLVSSPIASRQQANAIGRRNRRSKLSNVSAESHEWRLEDPMDIGEPVPESVKQAQAVYDAERRPVSRRCGRGTR